MLVKTVAEMLLGSAQSRQLRSAVDSKFHHNQPAQLWGGLRRCWVDGPRFLSDSGRNAVIEHCGKLPKVPLVRIRARNVSDAQEDVANEIDSMDQRMGSSLSDIALPVAGKTGSSL